MIYLIGGTPRSGKTTLAKILAKKLSCPYLQTDYISSALSAKMSEAEEKELFGEKSRDDSNWKDNETRFSVFSNEEQIEIYRKKAMRNRSGIKNIIEYAIADKEDYILEGYHLRPSIIHEDISKRGDKVKYLLLYKNNVEQIEQGIKVNTHPNDRVIKNTFKEETYRKIAEFLYEFGTTLHTEALQYSSLTYNTSENNFHQQLDTICKEILLS